MSKTPREREALAVRDQLAPAPKRHHETSFPLHFAMHDIRIRLNNAQGVDERDETSLAVCEPEKAATGRRRRMGERYTSKGEEPSILFVPAQELTSPWGKNRPRFALGCRLVCM